MKLYSTLICAGLMSSLLQAQPSASATQAKAEQMVSNYYTQAEKAYRAGDLETCTNALRQALKLNPNHGPSYALALKLKKSGPAFKVKAREKKFQSVVLPVAEFDRVPLEDALRDLGDLVMKVSEDQVIPNFVIQDKSGELQKREVTLNLKQIPAHVVLSYMMEMTGASAQFGEYAIVVKSKGQ